MRARGATGMRTARCAAACVSFVALAGITATTLHADEAGQRVHRCVGRGGEVVFSGLPCNEDAAAAGSISDATQAAPPVDVCATSAAQLRERVAGAVARHDANTIAGAMRWRGIGGREANARLAQLRALVREPLLSIADNGSGFEVKTGSHLDTGVRSAAFGIDSEGGCYWLTW